MRALRKPASSPISTPPGKVSLGSDCRRRQLGAGTIGNTLPPSRNSENCEHLEALEFLVGRQVRVGVTEADDEADGDLVVFQVVEEAATVGVGLHRPAPAMHDQAGLVLLWPDFPQFLEADAVGLRITVA